MNITKFYNSSDQLKIELNYSVPNNMTANKFHKTIKKLGGEIKGRLVIFDNQNLELLKETLINNGLI